jgi:ferric-dicitrate binding protein FerR (iron transport regulator)
VKGWSLENLETVMREATTGVTDPSPTDPVTSEAVASEAVASEAVTSEAVEPEAAPSAPVPRATRRQAARPPRRSTWRVFVTVVLLGALATAVTLVLLQSAGVISWSFLGPVA